MQTSNRILDDLAKVANGAASALSGIKAEIEAIAGHQIEKILVDLDLVARDEFNAVKAVASEARLQQEKLEKRVTELESQLAKIAGKLKSQPKKSRSSKTRNKN